MVGDLGRWPPAVGLQTLRWFSPQLLSNASLPVFPLFLGRSGQDTVSKTQVLGCCCDAQSGLPAYGMHLPSRYHGLESTRKMPWQASQMTQILMVLLSEEKTLLE